MNLRLSMVAGLLFAGLSTAIPARADDFDERFIPALSAEQADAANLKKKTVDQRPSEGRALGLVFDGNVPDGIRAQIKDDLDFVSAIQGAGATKLHEKIFGPVDGPTYLHWFSARIKEVDFDAAVTNPTWIAYVRGGSTMRLAPLYLKGRLPQMFRVDTLFHEARHTEPGNGWPHVKCPNPFKDKDGRDVAGIITGTLMAGSENCDDTPLGAYGVAAVMLKNIQRFCANCTEKTRMDAGLYADDDVKRVIGQAHQVIRTDLY